MVPILRIRPLNQAPPNPQGDYVLYWMTAYRRLSGNYALDRAVELAMDFGKPLMILEALEVDYPHASDRLHAFVLQGMAENREACRQKGVSYLPYVEPRPGEGRGLLAALAERAVLVVSDEFPCFFLPKIQAAAAGRLKVGMELVDSCGLLPLKATERLFSLAHSFRRFLQSELPGWLGMAPSADPLNQAARLGLARPPEGAAQRWPSADDSLLSGRTAALAKLPLDHGVPPVDELPGGPKAAEQRLAAFLADKLTVYHEQASHPDDQATSGLSPYLHFGHIGPHQIWQALSRATGWRINRLGGKPTGRREGWWGLDPGPEAFLDQLITWRELGFNYCSHSEDYAEYSSLPEWALTTLGEHANDPRPYDYSREQLEAADTHAPLWNAAQNQLRGQGVIHNYPRMLWGKKIFEWSPTPEQALGHMIHLNDRWALDGRDPNSYSGILWCLGRYDRAWGPERPVFGKIRYMRLKSAEKKLRIKEYIQRFA
jgi:deoxyribodipyrimidine photo-lyase